SAEERLRPGTEAGQCGPPGAGAAVAEPIDRSPKRARDRRWAGRGAEVVPARAGRCGDRAARSVDCAAAGKTAAAHRGAQAEVPSAVLMKPLIDVDTRVLVLTG